MGLYLTILFSTVRSVCCSILKFLNNFSYCLSFLLWNSQTTLLDFFAFLFNLLISVSYDIWNCTISECCSSDTNSMLLVRNVMFSPLIWCCYYINFIDICQLNWYVKYHFLLWYIELLRVLFNLILCSFRCILLSW